MPLITCPDCGKQISDRSAHCIHCGCPISLGNTHNVAPLQQKNNVSTASNNATYPQPKNNNNLLIAIIIVAVVVLGVLLIVVTNSHSKGSLAHGTSTESSAGSQISHSYTSYDIKEMMNDLEANAVRAQQKYKGQYLEVTGILVGMDSDGKYFSIHEKELSIQGLTCYMQNDAQKQQILSFNKGDKITVRGYINDMGEIIGYQMQLDDFSAAASSTTKEEKTVEKAVEQEITKAVEEVEKVVEVKQPARSVDFDLFNGTVTLKGKLGRYNVKMTVTKSGSTLSGTYYGLRNNMRVPMAGSYYDGYFNMYSTDGNNFEMDLYYDGNKTFSGSGSDNYNSFDICLSY